MDGIFDQLDALGRNGRSVPPGIPQRPAHNFGQPHQRTHDLFTDSIFDQPLVLDSFDHQVLQQADSSTRLGQAVLGRDRLTLPLARRISREDNGRSRWSVSQSRTGTNGPPYFEQSRDAGDLDQGRCATPSSSDQHLPSSPILKANLRHAIPSAMPRSAKSSNPLGALPGPSQIEPFSQHIAHPSQSLTASDIHLGESIPRLTQRARIARDPPTLPDRLRSIFPFTILNAVQSKCFDTIFNTNQNFVLSAPTGSGKTAVLELAICRLVNCAANGSFKIVYQAPTKSLCSERQRDWQKKFSSIGLECAELTGDTETSQLRSVQTAHIIVATPEKWDSVTRKWKDHQKLIHMIKLFLIDEVHMLKEERGATLEAVVSRMKSVASDVRFVALSATVPNSQDIAIWLGKSPTHLHSPAAREHFGEDFRPVRLKKHVCGYHSTSNDFAFDKTLSGKLPDVIKRWSQRKPIMVFCFTRGACVETAKMLAEWWTSNGPREQYWHSPRERIMVGDKDLRGVILSGVAFHHAGLTMQDRNAVEAGYLNGHINVICCTSTLAVGVNLPCHMVIIKNTVTCQSNAAAGCKEYSDLEIMQMLGRAGRPQFDDTAVAIIMTRLPRVQHYEKMVSGQEVLESCLHLNLIDHLNAEIGLGTITSAISAREWLKSTFLHVRLKENPGHYKIDGVSHGRNLDDRLHTICGKGLALLAAHDLVSHTPALRCTEFGDAMARYYVRFDTMKIFLALPKQAKVSEILSAISQASEFGDIRFRVGEKNVYKALNKNSSIKFPIPVNLDASAHKVSLIIQSVLGAIELETEDHKHRLEYSTAKSLIFQHASRLVRCIIDCQICKEDSIATRNALMLARSLTSQVWDDSPLHMKQLESIGLVTVRKLVAAGINSIEELETIEALRIEQILTRNPPFGTQLIGKARAFPKPHVSVKMAGEPIVRPGEHVTINLRADISFLNDEVPEQFHRKPLYVCLLAETSDGKLLQFARISAKKLSREQDILFEARLTNPSHFIRVYVMCDNLAGTLRYATLLPQISPSAFPSAKPVRDVTTITPASRVMNVWNRQDESGLTPALTADTVDEFDDMYIDDEDLAQAEQDGFLDIDQFDLTSKPIASDVEPPRKKRKTMDCGRKAMDIIPEQLSNGKWACKHQCKDKTTCRHLCCREGLDKKPKPSRSKPYSGSEIRTDPYQTQSKMPVTDEAAPTAKATTAMEKFLQTTHTAKAASKEVSELKGLQNAARTTTPTVATLRCTQAGQESTLPPPTKLSPHPCSSKSIAASAELDSMVYSNDIWDIDELPEIAKNVGNHTISRSTIDKHVPIALDEETLAGTGIASETLDLGPGDDSIDLSWLIDEQDFVDEEGDGMSKTLLDDVDATTLVTLGGYNAVSKTSYPGQESGLIPHTNLAAPTREDEAETGEGKMSSTTVTPVYETAGGALSALNHPTEGPGRRAGQRVLYSDSHRSAPDPTRSSLDDELEKWFHEYLGSDLFHYTG